MAVFGKILASIGRFFYKKLDFLPFYDIIKLLIQSERAEQMNIAVVDDNTLEREKLADIIRSYPRVSDTVSLFCSGEEFVSKYKAKMFDVVFLDIMMNEVNGIETARFIREKDSDAVLVFASSSNDFASESYSVHADDYILKPVTKEAVFAVLERAEKTKNRYEELLPLPNETVIRLKDILYTLRSGHYIIFVTSLGEERVRMSHAEVLNVLDKYPSFVECNQGSVVNLDSVEKLEDGRFLLKNGEYLPVSRRKFAAVKQIYFDYVVGALRS